MLMIERSEDAEILPVVDSRDRVIRNARRDEVHRTGLRHRAVHVLIFNQSGRFFFQQRALHKESSPGLWDSSVAGHVDAGETYDECCLREIREEVGITLERVPRRLFKLPAMLITDMEFCWIYRLDTSVALLPDYSEMLGGEWFTVPVIDQWIEQRPAEISVSFRFIWKRCRHEGLIKDE